MNTKRREWNFIHGIRRAIYRSTAFGTAATSILLTFAACNSDQTDQPVRCHGIDRLLNAGSAWALSAIATRNMEGADRGWVSADQIEALAGGVQWGGAGYWEVRIFPESELVCIRATDSHFGECRDMRAAEIVGLLCR